MRHYGTVRPTVCRETLRVLCWGAPCKGVVDTHRPRQPFMANLAVSGSGSQMSPRACLVVEIFFFFFFFFLSLFVRRPFAAPCFYLGTHLSAYTSSTYAQGLKGQTRLDTSQVANILHNYVDAQVDIYVDIGYVLCERAIAVPGHGWKSRLISMDLLREQAPATLAPRRSREESTP